MANGTFNPTKRYLKFVDPAELTLFEASAGMWFETPQEVRTGLDQGRKRAALLAWVRGGMAKHLTERERVAVELHYFENRTFAEIGVLTGTSASSSCRAVLRGIRRLRALTTEEPPEALLAGWKTRK